MDPALARWVRRQREANKKGEQLPYHKKLLNDLGFDWDRTTHIGIKPDEEKWNLMFATLIAYKKKQGHCGIQYSDKENHDIYNWKYKQREKNVREYFCQSLPIT